MVKWIALLTIIFNLGWAGESFQEGLNLFHKKKYEEALILFKNAELTENEQLKSLVGQLFCSAALGRIDQVDSTIQLIDYKVKEFTNCDTPPKNGPMTQEKQQMAYMCRRHIREIANEMRQTVEGLVRETVPGVFQKIKMLRQLYPFIDALEQTGLDCCQSNFPWACCMDPLLEQLESWNSFGLPR